MHTSIAILAFLSGLSYAACYNSATGYLCDQHGTRARPKNYNKSTWGPAESAVECSQLCLQYNYGRTGCVSLAYNFKSKQCQLFHKLLEDQEFTAGTSSFVYYDLSCFDCLNTCPVPTGKNLLANGGFDQFPHSLDPWTHEPNITYAGIVEGGFNSPRSYQLNYNEEEGDLVSQEFHTCPNGVYYVTFDYKYTSPVVPDRSLYVSIGELTYQANFAAANNGTWQYFKQLFRTFNDSGTTSQLLIIPSVEKDATFQLDNVAVVRMDDPSPGSEPSIVTNGGFEEGPTPWVTGANDSERRCGLTSPGLNSSTAFKCTLSEGRDNTLSQTLYTTPNATYRLSFDYKAVFTRKTNVCYFFHSFGSASYLGPGAFEGVANDTWLHYDAPLVAQDEETQLTFEFDQFYTEKNRCNLYVDNVSVVEAT